MAQGLIQPGSGPNRLPTSVIPSPATCSVEGLKDAACPWTWPPLPSFLAACPASSAMCPASPARYRGGRRAPTPQRSPSLALPRSAPRRDARPPWPAGRACRRRVPTALCSLACFRVCHHLRHHAPLLLARSSLLLPPSGRHRRTLPSRPLARAWLGHCRSPRPVTKSCTSALGPPCAAPPLPRRRRTFSGRNSKLRPSSALFFQPGTSRKNSSKGEGLTA